MDLAKRRKPASSQPTQPKRKVASKKTPRKTPRKSDVPPSLPKHIKGKLPYHKALVAYAKENPVETALTFLPIGGAAGLGLKAGKAASPALRLGKVAGKAKTTVGKVTRGLSKLFKRKSAAKNPFKGPTVPPSKPPGSGLPSRLRSGRGKETPTGKTSGRGSASGGKKASGPGSRTSRKPRTPKRETPAARKKRKDAIAERRERLDSGKVRVGIQKRGAGLAKGRKTQAEKRAARKKRRDYNL